MCIRDRDCTEDGQGNIVGVDAGTQSSRSGMVEMGQVVDKGYIGDGAELDITEDGERSRDSETVEDTVGRHTNIIGGTEAVVSGDNITPVSSYTSTHLDNTPTIPVSYTHLTLPTKA